MDNAVPIVPQAPAAQPLQIQSGVLTQVRASAAWTLSSAEVLWSTVENQIFGPRK